MSSAKWRQFCLGLNVLKQMKLNTTSIQFLLLTLRDMVWNYQEHEYMIWHHRTLFSEDNWFECTAIPQVWCVGIEVFSNKVGTNGSHTVSMVTMTSP